MSIKSGKPTSLCSLTKLIQLVAQFLHFDSEAPLLFEWTVPISKLGKSIIQIQQVMD
jgi:hypothetical protein